MYHLDQVIEGLLYCTTEFIISDVDPIKCNALQSKVFI